MATRAQIAEQFQEVHLDEHLSSECLALCNNYAISAEDLFFKWEALKFGPKKNSSFTTFDKGSIDALRAVLQREVEQKAKAAKAKTTRARLNNVFAGRVKTEPVSQIKVTPTSNLSGPSNAGSSARVNFKLEGDTPGEQKRRRYRYMFWGGYCKCKVPLLRICSIESLRLAERTLPHAVLDERIDTMAEHLREHYHIEEFADPASTTEGEVHIVGRICNDADSSVAPSTSKLNDSSVFLETSRMMGSGVRVPLRFDSGMKIRGAPQGAGSLGIFPGAIAAFKGRNGGGGLFVASEILALPQIPNSNEDNVKLESGSAGFTMWVASGPYTPDADMQYKPFASLMEKARSAKPPVLLLLGPFYDSQHPAFKSGDIDESPADTLQQKVFGPIKDFLTASPDSLVLLVPSVRDVLSDHPVFPQCEFLHDAFFDARVKMLPNPCSFSVDGVTFATTSVDTLFHLRNQELVLRGEEVEPQPTSGYSATETLGNTCRHLLQQRSFYPLFPVPADYSHVVNLDVTHAEELQLRALPDILILPSRLKHFTKHLDSTMGINPSFLTKKTYATISIGPQGLGSLKCEIAQLE